MKFLVHSGLAVFSLSAVALLGTACLQTGDTEEVLEEESTGQASSELVACNAPECIIYDIATQDACTEVTASASFDNRWVAGLSLEVDQTVKGGNIVAYQIQWFNGTWSGWYVPGVNDIDIKFNTLNKTMRRFWSYFYDHNHKYVICKKQP